MPDYEPVLLANLGKANSHTLAVYTAGGGYRALRRALTEMRPADVLDASPGQQPPRPRRGRFSHRAEVVLPAGESSRADLSLRQRR